jgi:hypothetical protein
VVFGGALPPLAGTVFSLILPAPLGDAVAVGLMLHYVFFFVATLDISVYISYRSVFHAGETLVPAARRQAS